MVQHLWRFVAIKDYNIVTDQIGSHSQVILVPSLHIFVLRPPKSSFILSMIQLQWTVEVLVTPQTHYQFFMILTSLKQAGLESCSQSAPSDPSRLLKTLDDHFQKFFACLKSLMLYCSNAEIVLCSMSIWNLLYSARPVPDACHSSLKVVSREMNGCITFAEIRKISLEVEEVVLFLRYSIMHCGLKFLFTPLLFCLSRTATRGWISSLQWYFSAVAHFCGARRWTAVQRHSSTIL